MDIFVVQMGGFIIHITMGGKKIVQIFSSGATQMIMKLHGLHCSRWLGRAIAMICRFTAKLGVLFSLYCPSL
jgi:hypothetical protein